MDSQVSIHPSAVVEQGAQLGSGVRIGPFCHISADAVIGDRVELVSHVSVLGATTIGQDCTVQPMAILGGPPQNTRHKGGPTTLVIGSNCTIREGVTMHRGTDASRGETIVGDNGNFLAYSHIAHDCIVGRNATLANVATLGGHVELGDFVTLGGLSAVHQLVRIGHHAFVGGGTVVVGDVMPYGMVAGSRGQLRGLNVIGMRRSGLPRSDIMDLRRAYKLLFDPRQPVSENRQLVAQSFPDSPIVNDVLGFINIRGKRHFTVPPLKGAVDADDDAED